MAVFSTTSSTSMLCNACFRQHHVQFIYVGKYSFYSYKNVETMSGKNNFIITIRFYLYKIRTLFLHVINRTRISAHRHIHTWNTTTSFSFLFSRYFGCSSNTRKCARNVTTIQITIHNLVNWAAICATLHRNREYNIATLGRTTFSLIRCSKNNGTWWVEYVFVRLFVQKHNKCQRVLTNPNTDIEEQNNNNPSVD